MKDLSLTSFKKPLAGAARSLKPYAGVLFFLLIAVMYAYLILKINSLSSTQVDQSAVDAEVQSAPGLHIDANAAKQLQTLKDNSSNVQTLFEQSRTSPFQE